MYWCFQPGRPCTLQPLIHSSIFLVTLFPLFAFVTLSISLSPPPLSLCQFSIRPLTEQSLCSYSELISQSSCSCASKDSSVSQVMGADGGVIKASLQFAIRLSTCVIMSSLCHYWMVLSQMKLRLLISSLLFSSLLSSSLLLSSSWRIRPEVCGIHLVYF